ncbi:MAG: hypothetical protein HY020_07175 [Burkholderiales bacterium]|nr:hypothetical protein [Burkholderiales bacterium]
MSKLIIEGLSLDGNHTRSAALDRDIQDPSAISGYMVTAAASAALKQIGTGLADQASQRAWKVVGPYGSGKTALAVVLSQLSAGQAAFPATYDLVAASAPKVAALFAGSRRMPIAIVGSRNSLGSALASSASKALAAWRTKSAGSMRKALDLPAGTYKGAPFNASAGDIAADLAAVAQGEGYGGILLLIDEVGKFVEHAALRPEEGDLIALQQIAERACTRGDDKLAIVVMLHQHFSSYAAGVGRSLADEWHKIASRFDEVAFDEPVERYAHFAAHALGAKPAITADRPLSEAANALIAEAQKLGVLRATGEADRSLFKHAARLYPIHPLTLLCLALVSKRYGQSERSFHAFLRGGELHGLRDFAQRHESSAECWFRLPELFDFVSQGHSLRFRDVGAERRWVFALATLDRQEFEPLSVGVLKAIAVLELLGMGAALPITPQLIAFALGEGSTGATAACCEALIARGVLLRRGATGYTFAVSDAVNIDAVYEKAAAKDEGQLAVAGLSHAMSQRLIVANKHYDQTGTIRTMGVLAGTATAWPKRPKTKTDELVPDAWLKLIIAVKGSDAEEEAKSAVKSEKDPLLLSAVLTLEPEGRAALAEYAIWLAVQREVDQKRLDPWTSQYVEGRLQVVRESVERSVLSQLLPVAGRVGPQYWHQGKAVARSQQMNLSQLASWLFDKVYPDSPRLVNELINKDRPPSAIVLARQRMFEVILGGDTTAPICKPTDFPPERLIHHTLFRETGLWKEADGHWSLVDPSADAPINITPLWNRISELLQAKPAPTVQGVLDALAAPPFGVRAGPAGIWLAAYLLIRRSQSALFDRGTLQLEVTYELLQRMFKNPGSFEIRELEGSEASSSLLFSYQSVLSSIGCPVDGQLTFLELARSLYLWRRRLPDFAMQTGRISKEASLVRTALEKASDPIELLTGSLPKLHQESGTNEVLGAWLTRVLSELGTAHRKLQEQITQEVGIAFEMTGKLGHVRSQLQAECAGAASDLGDVKLKSFVLRCTDLSLTDEKWLDSIGSLIVHKPLDTWTDDTMGKFVPLLHELCAQYKRWLRYVIQRGKVPREAERFVGVTLTRSGGLESSLFVAATEKSTKLARTVTTLLEKEARGDAKLAAAALAQALADLQASIESGVSQGGADADRKAS